MQTVYRNSMDYSFGKRYMLKSKKTIDGIFKSGIHVKSYPFVAIMKFVDFEDEIPFKMVFSAPKKKFRHAHTRNRIKRICKEAIRLNKGELENYLLNENKQLAVFLVYSAPDEIHHSILQKKAVKLIKTLIKTLDEQKH